MIAGFNAQTLAGDAQFVQGITDGCRVQLSNPFNIVRFIHLSPHIA